MAQAAFGSRIPQSSEILSIKLRGVKSQASDLIVIVNAVASAYKQEVLGNERAQRYAERDLLEHSLQELRNEIKHKYADYLEIAKGAGNAGDGDQDIRQQLDIKRIDRIDAELMRLEGEQLKGETNGPSENSRYIKQRMEQLRKREKELEQELAARSSKSIDLMTRRHELNQLQRIADQLAEQLEAVDIDIGSPSQIREVQPAIITNDK